MNFQKQQGFTLMEVLIVIFILALISGFLILGFKNFSDFQQFRKAKSDVELVLNQTRLSARSSENDSSHGVKFTASSIIKFQGSTYNALDPLNETHSYPLVTFDLELTGGTDEIIFSKLTGLPSATGTVVIEGSRFNSSTTIEITDSGVIQ